jgi:IS30 family transposase
MATGPVAFHTLLLPVLGTLAEYVRLTLTWDQGSEMALHERISEHFRDGVYFAYPASPRQGGTNENTMAFYANTFRKARRWPALTTARFARWKTGSTTGHARCWVGVPGLKSVHGAVPT